MHPGADAETDVGVHGPIGDDGEPDLTDPVHGRVGGEYTTAAFDTEHFQA